MVKRALIIAPVVAALLCSVNTAHAYPLDYKTMFLVTAKMDPLFDADSALDDFIQLFRPEVYSRFHSDEFVYQQKKEATLPIMKSMIEGYDLKQPIVATLQLSVGNYDFTHHAFPLVNLTEATYFPVMQNCCQDIPQQIKVFFSNTTSFSNLPVSEDQARSFVERHHLEPNNNRIVTAQVSFLPVKIEGNDEVTASVIHIIAKDPQTGQVLAEMDVPQSAE